MVWLRPWRLAAGVAFGLALATKWNSIFLLAVLGIVSVLWDVGARRLAGADWHGWLSLLVDGIPAFVRMVVVAALVYVSTWAGWLLTTGGYDRGWGASNPDHPWVKFIGDPWASLLWYHKEMYEFHVGDFINNATHPYDAHPAGWLVVARPIGIDAVNDIAPGTDGCLGPDNCIRVISGMGTPVLWWMAAIALVVAAIWWLGGRDWRFGLPVIATAALYLPWFNYADRPVFFFYAITFVPFTVIALALVLGLILGPANGPHRRRGAIIVGVLVALVAANFALDLPHPHRPVAALPAVVGPDVAQVLDLGRHRGYHLPDRPGPQREEPSRGRPGRLLGTGRGVRGHVPSGSDRRGDGRSRGAAPGRTSGLAHPRGPAGRPHRRGVARPGPGQGSCWTA